MNFKKCTSIIMAFYLLISSSGLAFNVHYCGDTIASVSSVFNTEDPCETEVHPREKSCCAISLENHDGCCSNETIQADFDDVVIKQLHFDFDYVSVLPTVEFSFYTNRVKQINEQLFDYYCDANAPPLYQLYTQLVFYA
ncbi:MAG: HYC_CC_PP family protein [Flavobacterium sp.]|uniref:HYC_CC_PP family protein n=1 Tax=Flavobacterium sp. TaxID=239 RepID=UPI003BA43865